MATAEIQALILLTYSGLLSILINPILWKKGKTSANEIMNGSKISKKLDLESWVSMPWLMNIRRKIKSPINNLGFTVACESLQL